ncbi:MAG: TRAP transporter small permease subunit [Alphaproteobacteria bacterium]|nr:TRAP transporter small permease subunit [Alphaproteobacteria bacterium]
MQKALHFANFIDALNRRIGASTAWLATLLVVVQFIVVLLRYVFGIGALMLQESRTYMFSILFMLGAGYTLLQDGHVRVDIFYRTAKPSTKAVVDLLGSLFFLIPVCVLILIISRPYVAASWAVLEGSKETSGIPGIFLLKSLIPLFAILLILQGAANAIRAFATLTRSQG